MNYHEFGTDRAETVILLHGGGLSWWNFREVAELLRSDYHVILPILDGHAGSDRAFSSIEDAAAGIISFVDEHLSGHVLLVGGLSLGGQILLEMLSQRADICKYALVESAAVLPSGVAQALIGPAIASSYGLIRKKSFAKLQFHSLHMKQELFEDYYRDTCRIKKADMVSFMQASTAYALKDRISGTSAQVHVFVGEKETREILQSADVICQAVSGSQKEVLAGLYHGEFSMKQPLDYVRSVLSIIGNG